MEKKTVFRSCPLCGEYDSICSVREAIWADTHIIRTSGVTIGWVDPKQTSTSHFTSVSTGDVANSLAYPNKPFSFVWFGIALLYGLAVSTAIGAIKLMVELLPKMDSPLSVVMTIFYCLIFGLILNALQGLFYGTLGYVVLFISTISKRAQWKKQEEYYLNSDYCPVDEVVFDDEVALPPREFVQYVFES